ncbi:replication initiator protein [Microviridae sp.]|nr:replication initiator protein [Microviridae sp.]
MPCIAPLQGWKHKVHGGFTGTRQLAVLDAPLTVPCQKCISCRLEKSRQWAIRCDHENKMHDYGMFLTLTYDDQHLPPGQTLERSHVPSFFKRLRRRRPRLRIFYCGEYGETTLRPHYHALVWGWEPPDKTSLKNSKGKTIYESQIINDKWGHGHCNFGDITFESAAYVARYTTKKITGAPAADHYQTFNNETGEIFWRLPEFSGSSRRPGIGIPFLAKYFQDIYAKDQIIVRGRAMRPPLAYDRWLKEHHFDLWESVMERRREHIPPTIDDEQSRYKKGFNHAKARTKILEQKLQKRDQHS